MNVNLKKKSTSIINDVQKIDKLDRTKKGFENFTTEITYWEKKTMIQNHATAFEYYNWYIFT